MNFRMSGVNDVAARNIYPQAMGMTIGERGSAMTPDDSDFGSESAVITSEGATGPNAVMPTGGGFIGKPLSWWFVLLALLIGVMYVGRKIGGQSDEFKNLKLSAYNVIVISLAAVVGIGFLKVVFNKVKVPGLTTFVNAV